MISARVATENSFLEESFYQQRVSSTNQSINNKTIREQTNQLEG